MAYKTGLRLLACFFCLTGIGIPIGILLWWKARREEKKIERRKEAQEKFHNQYHDGGG